MSFLVAMFSEHLTGPAQAGRRPQHTSWACTLRRQTGIGVALGGILLLASGCGGGDAQIKVAPVSGVVKYNGVPVRDAYVKFSQKGCPIVAGGFTDDVGRFELTSYE